MQTRALTARRRTSLDTVTCDPEAQYNREVALEHRRRFAQVFTPPKLADLMADWAMGRSPRHLLDPALGTGVLTAACLNIDSELDVTAFEIDERVLNFARDFPANVSILNRDFIREQIVERYDAVVMNPPYIRHREISGYTDELSLISSMALVSIPKSANLYIYFCVKALELLKENGRAAILIPAEWMSANFSKSFKEYLLGRSLLRSVVTFSNCSNVFDDALTTASILLCEK